MLKCRCWCQTTASPRSLLAFGTQVLEQHGSHSKFQWGLSHADKPQSLPRNFPGHGRNITFISSTASHQLNKQRFKNKPKQNNTSANHVRFQLFSPHNQKSAKKK